MSLKKILQSTGLAVALLGSACSDKIEKPGKLELTFWHDFNGNKSYEIGEEFVIPEDVPVYMSNKSIRLLYKGKPNQKVTLSIMEPLWPTKIANDCDIVTGPDGFYRLSDDSEFLKKTNKFIQARPGKYVFIAKPSNSESIVFKELYAAFPPNMYEIEKEQTEKFLENRRKNK